MDQCQRYELHEMYKGKMKGILNAFLINFLEAVESIPEEHREFTKHDIEIFIDKWVEAAVVMEKFDEEGKSSPNWLDFKKMLEDSIEK